MIFERKVMRKIFGPTGSDDGCWRNKTNQEINDRLKGQNIIGFIKKQRLKWLGHVECMAEDNNTGQQNLTFFLAHEEKYLVLIELLKLNSNV